MSALSRTDRLLLAYLAALAVAMAAHGLLVAPELGAAAALACALTAVAWAARRWRPAAVAHDFAPIGAVIAAFFLTCRLVTLTARGRFDGAVAATDARWFAALAGPWSSAFGRPAALTDAASLVYATWYVLPVVIAVALWRRDRAAFQRYAFAVCLTFVLTWVGYFILPTVGPRAPAARADALLGGGAIAHALRAFVSLSEPSRLDAFPSAHTAVALVVFGYGARARRAWTAPLGLLASAIVFTTVYLSFHYVTDVAAGFAIAGAVLLLLPIAERAS
jgi:membrane-associated phospholipid phosphatase